MGILMLSVCGAFWTHPVPGLDTPEVGPSPTHMTQAQVADKYVPMRRARTT
jgi:hypothetical protein